MRLKLKSGLLSALTLAASMAWADTLELKNGSLIKGKFEISLAAIEVLGKSAAFLRLVTTERPVAAHAFLLFSLKDGVAPGSGYIADDGSLRRGRCKSESQLLAVWRWPDPDDVLSWKGRHF